MAYWKEKTKPPKTSSVNAAGRHSGGGVGHEAAQKEAFGPIGWGVGWGGGGGWGANGGHWTSWLPIHRPTPADSIAPADDQYQTLSVLQQREAAARARVGFD